MVVDNAFFFFSINSIWMRTFIEEDKNRLMNDIPSRSYNFRYTCNYYHNKKENDKHAWFSIAVHDEFDGKNLIIGAKLWTYLYQ